MIPDATDGTFRFRYPESMTPEDVGDNLAQLVWESFSDFITDGDAETVLGDHDLATGEGLPADGSVEELLIYLMWAHTRGAQMAFAGRASSKMVRRSLDALHNAVFEDMVTNGTPRSQIPLFEQHVSSRYAEYYAAAEMSDAALGEAVARHLTGAENSGGDITGTITERAIAVAKPLGDFLGDVELVD